MSPSRAAVIAMDASCHHPIQIHRQSHHHIVRKRSSVLYLQFVITAHYSRCRTLGRLYIEVYIHELTCIFDSRGVTRADLVCFYTDFHRLLDLTVYQATSGV